MNNKNNSKNNPENHIYGFHSINAYLEQNSTNVEVIYIDQKRKDRKDKRISELISNAQKHQVFIKPVAYEELDKLCNNQQHQGVVAKITNIINLNNKINTLNDILHRTQDKKDATILILDGITDPHNLGAIIRTADCFGVDAIILPQNNSANINNAVVAKTSSGAIQHVPIITVTNLSRTIQTLKQHDFWIFGTSLTTDSISLTDFTHKGKTVWVMGNEGTGLRRLVTENCDYLVTIPMYGNTQSLNVSVATGVILSYTKFIKK